MFRIDICWKSTDVRGKIKSEPHSEVWQNPTANILFFLQLNDQKKVHLCSIPRQTYSTPNTLWIMEIVVNVRGVFQHLHRIHRSVGVARRDRKKRRRDAQSWVTGRIFSFLYFHMHFHHWTRAQWPIPFPYEILMSEAFVNNICSDATFYWLPVRECPIRLALIWKLHFCGLVQQ